MKHSLRISLSLLLALTLAFGAFSAGLAAFAADPVPAETASVGAGAAEPAKTDGGRKTDGAPDATATDATATDATATDATATDAPSAAAAEENGYTFVVSNGQAVILAADETVKGDVTSPDTLGGAPVGIVGMGAFRGNGAIVSVSLPDTVAVVDEYAFADCAALERIECGKALRSLPESAYAGCASLHNDAVLFANQSEYFVSGLDGNAIYDRDQTELISVSRGVSGAFTVPKTVKYVRAGAFRDCAALTEVTFENPETAVGAYAFAGCAALEKAELPEKLTEIAEGLFSGCAALREVTIPGGLTAIGDSAFAGCAALPEYVIPKDCLRLGCGVFAGCAALKKAAVFAPVAALPDSLFEGCAALKEVQIPDTVDTVGERTFFGCAALENVGDMLRYRHFGRDAFTGTAWYEKQVDAPYFCGNTLVFYKGAADKAADLRESKITVVAPGAFAGNATVETVLLPDCVEEIGASAFEGCAKLVSVPLKGAVRIGADAFKGTALAEAAAGGELYIGGNLILAATPTDAAPATATDATATDATATDATATDAAPAVYPVRPGTKSIASGAFRALPGLEEIVLPDGVEILSDGAFAGLNGLKKVNIPDSVRYGDNAFDGVVPACAHPDTVLKYADTAVCTRSWFSGCVYCADCAALLDAGAIRTATGHRFRYVKEEVDPVMHEVVVIVACTVCEEEKRIPLSEYNVTFTDSERAYADGGYVIITMGVTAGELLRGCPAASLALDAAGDPVPAEQTMGSGMTVLFPSSREYTVILFGDADGDGLISPADARIALRLSVNLEKHIEWRDKACHVVFDGRKAVTSEDARMILRASVRLEDPAAFGKAKTPATPTDATPTDATPTDATPTDATPTDAEPQDKTDDPDKPKPEKTYLPGTYVCTSEGGVYLRAYHDFDSSPMDIIRYSETVRVKDVWRDDSGEKPVWWGRITHNGVTGWSALEYFSEK